MIRDIAQQVKHPIHGRYMTEDTWKPLLLRAYGKEVEVELSLDGTELVVISGTSDLGIPQASEFIEFLYAFGAEQDVRWTNPKDELANTARTAA